jgi:hypothetical protein
MFGACIQWSTAITSAKEFRKCQKHCGIHRNNSFCTAMGDSDSIKAGKPGYSRAKVADREDSGLLQDGLDSAEQGNYDQKNLLPFMIENELEKIGVMYDARKSGKLFPPSYVSLFNAQGESKALYYTHRSNKERASQATDSGVLGHPAVSSLWRCCACEGCWPSEWLCFGCSE